MAVRFRIDQQSRPTLDADLSRHDLVPAQTVTLVAVEPVNAPGVVYQWEIIDRYGTTVGLNQNNQASVTLNGPPQAPFAFLIELRVFVNGVFAGSARRIASARSPNRSLRVPLFLETADPTSRLSAPKVDGSTDNAHYDNLAGSGAPGQNWRGFAEAFAELVTTVDALGGAGEAAGDVEGPLGELEVVGLRGRSLVEQAPDLGQVLGWSAEGWKPVDPPSPGGMGDVVGPPVANDNAVARFDAVTGKLLQNSSVTIDDSGNIQLAATKTIDGRDPSVDGTKLDGIEVGAQVVTAARVATGLAGAASSLSVNSQRITSLADPTGAQDAATRAFVLANAGTPNGAIAPATSADEAVARFDGVNNKTLQASPVTISDTGNITMPGGAMVDGRDVSVDGTKLDGIEAGAQVTSTARVLTAIAAAASDVSVNGRKITNLADPVSAQDAATRAWVLANAGGTGAGDVSGPASSVDNALPRYDGTTGKLLQSSALTIDDTGNVSLPGGATVDGRDVSVDGTKLDGIEAGAQAVSFSRVSAALAAASADVAVNARKITGLADPVSAQDAATRAYVLANVGVAGGWTMALDVNFCALSTQTIVDGANTIAGVPWTAGNIASGAASCGLVSGTGLSMRANSTNTELYFSNNTGPYVQLLLKDVIPGFVLGQTRVRATFQWSSNGAVNHEAAKVMIRRVPHVANNVMVWNASQGFFDGSGPRREYNVLNGSSARGNFTPNTSSTSNVVCIDLDGITRAHWYSAVTAAANSAANSAVFSMADMKLECFWMANPTTGINNVALGDPVALMYLESAADLAVVLGIQTVNTAGNLLGLFQRLRIEYKL